MPLYYTSTIEWMAVEESQLTFLPNGDPLGAQYHLIYTIATALVSSSGSELDNSEHSAAPSSDDDAFARGDNKNKLCCRGFTFCLCMSWLAGGRL